MLSAVGIQEWAHAARTALGVARPEIDALNVFPVPDGDTGTNAYLTMESACTAADAAMEGEAGRSAVIRALARGAMLGARGNSGVILSEYLRGLGEVLCRLPDERQAGGAELAAMLARGAEVAYQAVSEPVEGTILTVARAAAEAAAEAGADAAQVARQAAAGARDALRRTPGQLPALAAAGVVDAGGRALVVILDALVASLAGESQPSAPVNLSAPGSPQVPADLTQSCSAPVYPRAASPDSASPDSASPDSASPDSAYTGPAYEVMFLLHGSADAASTLRIELERLGDSVLVVGDGSLWRVHAHVDDAGAAIEAGMELGQPHRIQVTTLAVRPPSHPVSDRELIAVVHGEGIAEMLADLQVRTLWAEPQRQPSMAEILGAIEGSQAVEVILLPSDKDTQPVAELAARQARRAGRRVAVIPTRAVVQTLAAIAVHDPCAAFDDDAVAMTRAAGATRYAAVTIASRQALTTAGPCAVGDALGVVDGDIAIVGATIGAVAHGVLDAMLAVGGELVTLVLGVEADEEFGRGLADWLATSHPTVEVITVRGGQPRWPVIIGVE